MNLGPESTNRCGVGKFDSQVCIHAAFVQTRFKAIKMPCATGAQIIAMHTLQTLALGTEITSRLHEALCFAIYAAFL